MTDVLTPDQRRLNMSRIKGGNTKPEKTLRSALHAQGLRFRLHRRDLPGCPDIVFPSARLAVFVDGCFWHGCPTHGAKPKTNIDFWRKKLRGNRERDNEVSAALEANGWKVLRYWEHDVKERTPQIVRSITSALRSQRRRR